MLCNLQLPTFTALFLLLKQTSKKLHSSALPLISNLKHHFINEPSLTTLNKIKYYSLTSYTHPLHLGPQHKTLLDILHTHTHTQHTHTHTTHTHSLNNVGLNCADPFIHKFFIIVSVFFFQRSLTKCGASLCSLRDHNTWNSKNYSLSLDSIQTVSGSCA